MSDTANLAGYVEGYAEGYADCLLDLEGSSDIILIRKVDGEWPEWATSVSFTEVFTAEDRNPGLRFRTMPEVLDALSDSLAKEGEG